MKVLLFRYMISYCIMVSEAVICLQQGSIVGPSKICTEPVLTRKALPLADRCSYFDNLPRCTILPHQVSDMKLSCPMMFPPPFIFIPTTSCIVLCYNV